MQILLKYSFCQCITFKHKANEQKKKLQMAEKRKKTNVFHVFNAKKRESLMERSLNLVTFFYVSHFCSFGFVTLEKQKKITSFQASDWTRVRDKCPENHLKD